MRVISNFATAVAGLLRAEFLRSAPTHADRMESAPARSSRLDALSALVTPSDASHNAPLSWPAARRWAETEYRATGFDLSLAGNPESQESVICLAQCHNLGTPSSQMLAAESQPKILDALLHLKPKNLFVEALDRDVAGSTIMQQGGLPDLRPVFKTYRAGRPLQAAQRNALVIYGAAAVYAALNPDCTLRATSTPALEAQTMRAIQEQRLPSGAVNQMRERHIVSRLDAACAERPAEPSVLIMGASHALGVEIKASSQREPNYLWLNTSGLPLSDVREAQAYFAAQNRG